MLKNFLFLIAISIAFSCSIGVAFAQTAAPESVANPTPTPDINLDETQADKGVSILDRPDYDPNEPTYERINPNWALGLRAAFRGFPTQSAVGSTFQIFGEYLLPFQQIGIFSLGPHVGSFPLYAPETGIPYPAYQNAIAGAAFRYQLRITKGQWVVPMIAFEWEYYRIKEATFNDNFLTGNDMGISLGAMIYLNVFDRVTARDGYRSLGLVRSYFTLELRSTNIRNPLFDLSGNYWLFGVRTEFE